MLIISPHCDDAVFACGSLLETYPGSTVVTVCAEGPSPDGSLTEWDRSSGFQVGDDVMALRRGEDVLALSRLGAHALWLSFYDSQYRNPTSYSDMVRALSVVVETVSPHSLFIPMGLFTATIE
jgi:LmbE family N-acetylglucosaminyl deacetylase